MRIRLIAGLLLSIFVISACGSKQTATTVPPITSKATATSEAYQPPTNPTEGQPSGSGQTGAYPAGTQSGSVNEPAKPVTPHPTATLDPVNSPVIISSVTNENGLETIYVTNISTKPQDITGFTLLIPDSSDHINFPQTILAPGDSLKVYNGPEAKNQTDGLAWRDQPALNIIGEGIYLLNRTGRLIWAYTKTK